MRTTDGRASRAGLDEEAQVEASSDEPAVRIGGGELLFFFIDGPLEGFGAVEIIPQE